MKNRNLELEKVSKELIAFRTTHNRPDEIEACFAYCANYFKDLPVTIERFMCEGVPSMVIQNAPGRELDVLFVGHIDVAEGPDSLFTSRVENGKLYGRGSCDMKAFVATSLVALRELIEGEYTGKVGLILVSDEELGGARGSRYLVEEVGYRARVVLVPDDGDTLDTIVSRSKHIFSFSFSARGKSAHGNRPWDGVNAIELLLKTFARLQKSFPAYETTPQDAWVNTMNLGTISGGFAANEVPAHAVMGIDIRIVPPTTREDVLAAVAESCAPGVEATLVNEGQPTFMDESSPLIQSYAKLVERISGKQVRYKHSGGGTDARYFAASGMPVIVHQGTCADAQGEKENVSLDTLEKLVEIQTTFVLDELGRALTSEGGTQDSLGNS